MTEKEFLTETETVSEEIALDVAAESELPPSTEVFEGEGGGAIPENHELANYEAAEIEEQEFIEVDRLTSIIESIFFASERPVTLEAIKAVFKGTNIKTKDIRRAIDEYAGNLARADRGVTLEEVGGGYQLRTKLDNANFMRRHVKGRAFRLSGPALEVISIVAYKQPVVKGEVDEIRGVESGHLMRALMDRGLIRFGEKSELPGKPMFYETTRKFLEIFGLRNIKELPSLSEIDELIPDGIGEIEEEKKTLSDLTGELSLEKVSGGSYSDGENELLKIGEQLASIDTSSDFFEQEKARQKRKREEERAQDIREAMMMGQEVPDKDVKWLKKFETALEEEKRMAEAAAAAPQSPNLVLDATHDFTEPGDTVVTEAELADEAGELSDGEILEAVDFEMQNDEFAEQTAEQLATDSESDELEGFDEESALDDTTEDDGSEKA